MASGTSTRLFADYPALPGTWDELLTHGQLREELRSAMAPLDTLAPEELRRRAELAALSLLNQGVTFSVYSDAQGTEKVFPFCPVPRVITARDWAHLERGIEQRIRALEAFLADVYGRQRVFAESWFPEDLLLSSSGYLAKLKGIVPPGGIRIHVGGIDLIRDPDGVFRVLEDNLRCPSGVSYVLENRVVTQRVLPELHQGAPVREVDTYPSRLADALRAVSPTEDDATTMVLTPGPYNSAYFEHTFLARTMGCSLVQSPDLYVDDDKVWVRTTKGPQRVHGLYRRTDETFLDPEVFRPDSMLGVPGIMRAWAKGNVALCNAPGNGVADDKAIYPLVPELVRYYLGESPILEQVPTYMCMRPDDCTYVLEHLEELVVKAVDEAGGYGMLMGPQSTRAEREVFAAKIRESPRRYIAQPRVELSTTPTWIPETGRVEARRVDLRPYVVSTPDGPWVLKGGLTRVALVEGSYVVNSSQGGGSKDTWVLED